MKTILMGFGVESRVEKEDSMTEDESRSNFGLAQWTQRAVRYCGMNSRM